MPHVCFALLLAAISVPVHAELKNNKAFSLID